MYLAEKITHLRKSRGLSQIELAEKLNVSRQSISKWETGASVPELDKLVAISDLFGVTLDELIKDAPPQSPPAPEAPQPEASHHSTQQIIGYILLGAGLLCIALGFMLLRTGLVLGLILVIYGWICLAVKRHAGLVIGWATMLPILLLHRNYTGIRLFSVFTPGYYDGVVTIASLMAWVIWISLALLVFFTIRALRKK